MRFHRIIAAAWLALLCAVAAAHAEKRVALVIGNSAYTNISPLRNPASDAREPADGSVWTTGICNSGRIVRGGSWYDDRRILRSALRNRGTGEYYGSGFRLARTLTP